MTDPGAVVLAVCGLLWLAAFGIFAVLIGRMVDDRDDARERRRERRRAWAEGRGADA